jgi:uncharacterized glyoxalase superfamily protein PhnB
MDTTKTMTAQSIYPAVRYRDAKAAIAWLTKTLGFEEHVVYAGDGDSIAHAELKLAGNLIMLGSVKDDSIVKSPRDLGGISASIYIALDSAAAVDARHQRVKDAGGEITRELEDTDYGSREFSVRDLEGHLWSFGTYRPQAGDPTT